MAARHERMPQLAPMEFASGAFILPSEQDNGHRRAELVTLQRNEDRIIEIEGVGQEEQRRDQPQSICIQTDPSGTLRLHEVRNLRHIGDHHDDRASNPDPMGRHSGFSFTQPVLPVRIFARDNCQGRTSAVRS